MLELRKFYADLYTEKLDECSFDDCTFAVEPKLSMSDIKNCEAPITLTECTMALGELPLNKSPGSDGLSANFYRVFWDYLKDRFIKCVNEVQKQGELSIEQRRGIITLLPKEGKDLRYVKNWRPISLLNTDYKIITKVLANRIQCLLPDLLHRDQTGFVSGRYIGENIQVVNDVMHFCNNNNVNGLLVLLDYEKAFDSINWSFMQYALKCHGFGIQFINWVKTVYTNISSTVINNGHMTESFNLSRGIRQGCPLSAFLFILSVELLADYIRKNNDIKGITIGNLEFKIVQFADDTAVFVKDMDSLGTLLETLELFYCISGLKINKEKCSVIKLGNKSVFYNLDQFGLKFTTKAFKYLGIWFTDDIIESEYLNFHHRLENIENLLKMWRQRDLSLKGKVCVIKTLALSQLIYPISMLFVPQSVF